MKLIAKIVVPILVVLVVVVVVLNSGKTVGTTWTQADYTHALAKTKMRIDNISSVGIEHLYRRAFTVAGRVSVNDSFTAAEIT